MRRPNAHPIPRPTRLAVVLATVLVTVLVMIGACATPSSSGVAGDGAALDPANWPAVLGAARGQTLNWYLYGGDQAINAVVSSYVAPQLAAAGITLNPVRVTDTADAVNKVLAEKQAGRADGGAVDAIWINGENFATGVQAKLWRCGYPAALPNARYLNLAGAAMSSDFGVPVALCETPWQQANSALVYDSTQLTPTDVASLAALEGWARTHPGRFTYPAPPDFTGSMVVRTFLYDTLGGPTHLPASFDPAAFTPAVARLWPRLTALGPSLWRAGATYPTSQDAVEKLYGDGEISAYVTYGPGTVKQKVATGVYPPSTREAVPDVGNISNTSFVAIPANAAHPAAALVLANLLADPQTQLRFYSDAGIYPAIDLTRTSMAVREQFAAVSTGPSVLSIAALTSHAQPELAAGYVSAIDKGWTSHVLQRNP